MAVSADSFIKRCVYILNFPFLPIVCKMDDPKFFQQQNDELQNALADEKKRNALLEKKFKKLNTQYNKILNEQKRTNNQMELLLNKLEEVIVEYQEKENQLEIEHALLEKAYHNLEDKTKQLEQKNVELAQLDRMKSNFLSMISHELRTPITVVQGNTEILLDHMQHLTPQQAQNLLESMFVRIRELIIMVETLLNLASVEADNFGLALNWIDPTMLLPKVREYINPIANQKNISFSIRQDPDIPPIYIDLEKLELVLINLLSNAVKFNKNDGMIDLEISFKNANNDQCPQLCITVADSGIGIHHSKLEDIFQKFYQIDSTNTRRYGGSGLGLALAREVVKRHGGEIKVESTLGIGSTFYIRIPQKEPVPDYTKHIFKRVR